MNATNEPREQVTYRGDRTASWSGRCPQCQPILNSVKFLLGADDREEILFFQELAVAVNPFIKKKVPDGLLIPFLGCIVIFLETAVTKPRHVFFVEYAGDSERSVALQKFIINSANNCGSPFVHNVAVFFVKITPWRTPRQRLEAIFF